MLEVEYVGHESHVSRSLDSLRYFLLVLESNTRVVPRSDLVVFRDELCEKFRIFIVDDFDTCGINRTFSFDRHSGKLKCIGDISEVVYGR